jgi:hypothetical protein
MDTEAEEADIMSGETDQEICPFSSVCFFPSSQGPRAASIEMPHARRQSLHHCHLGRSHQKAMPSTCKEASNPKSCGRRPCYCFENADWWSMHM